jgi:hypothetical protein
MLALEPLSPSAQGVRVGRAGPLTGGRFCTAINRNQALTGEPLVPGTRSLSDVIRRSSPSPTLSTPRAFSNHNAAVA